MAEDTFNDEARLMEDMAAFRGLLTNVASTPAQSPADIEAAYQNLRPAMTRIVGEEAVPQQYDPGFIESGMIYTNNMQSRVQDLRAMRAVPEVTQDVFGSRANAAFDADNPVDAQFLDANGVPSFNNNNYKDFLRTRGVPNEMIDELSKTSENDLLALMDQMTPNEQMQVVNTLATVSGNLAKARAQAVKDDPFRLTEKTRSEAQDELKKAGQNLVKLDEIQSRFDERFLNTPRKALKNINQLRDKFGLLNDTEAKEFIGEYNEWFNGTIQFFNEYRKETTGVAFSEKEQRDLEKAIINGNMSPTQYAGTVKAMKDNLNLVAEIRTQMLNENRVMTLPQLQQRLQDSGRLRAIPGTAAATKSSADGSNDAQLMDRLRSARDNGDLSDNALRTAAAAQFQRDGLDFSKLSEEQQRQYIQALAGKL